MHGKWGGVDRLFGDDGVHMYIGMVRTRSGMLGSLAFSSLENRDGVHAVPCRSSAAIAWPEQRRLVAWMESVMDHQGEKNCFI